MKAPFVFPILFPSLEEASVQLVSILMDFSMRYSIVVKRMDSGTGLSEFESCLCQLLTVLPWAT